MSRPIHDDDVRDALRQVMDPEAGMNIVDLGLLYGIDTDADGLTTVQLTMTSAGCPMTGMILDDAQAALERSLGADAPVRVELVWDPPWTPERMTDLAREHFGWAPR